MSLKPPANNDQTTLWNGPAGRAWVRTQAVLDTMFEPLQAALLDAAQACLAPRSPGLRLLDVGCGTGGTTLAFAERLGATARCTGVDLSEPMLALARTRAQTEAANVAFIQADAQTHAFESAGFDLLVSRFGVMFFDDPVAAFANLRRATRTGGALRMLAWRGADANPFMTAAERAAAPLLPALPARPPGAPGQFAFADGQRVRQILGRSGWDHVDIQPLDAVCSLPASALTDYLTWMGPVGALLQQADSATRDRVLHAMRPAFAPYVHGDTVRYTAACWMIAAQAGQGEPAATDPSHAEPGPTQGT